MVCWGTQIPVGDYCLQVSHLLQDNVITILQSTDGVHLWIYVQEANTQQWPLEEDMGEGGEMEEGGGHNM